MGDSWYNNANYWKGGRTMDQKTEKTVCNIGLLAHVDAGKTTLSEALLYAAGARRAPAA